MQAQMIISTPFLSNCLNLWMGCITISLLRFKVYGRQCSVINGIITYILRLNGNSV
jgi:hypothetical protein